MNLEFILTVWTKRSGVSNLAVKTFTICTDDSPMNSLFKLPLFLAFLIIPASCLAAIDRSAELPEPTVSVKDEDGTLQLNISYRVPVSPREAWSVLTDFDHMANFVPNLESSQVTQRSSKSLQIEQRGSISLGMIPIHYESKRQIELTPYKMIRSHSLSGNTRLDSIMVLTPIGKDTLLAYRATAVPDLPVPSSMVGSYMGEMLENQFKAMGQEMLRRTQANETNNENENARPAQQPSTQPAQQPSTQPVQASAQQTSTPVTSKKTVQTRTTPKKRR